MQTQPTEEGSNNFLRPAFKSPNHRSENAPVDQKCFVQQNSNHRKHGNDDEKIGMISRSLIILVSLLPIVSLGKERPPNIVLFMAEDIGNDLACYGHPYCQNSNPRQLGSQRHSLRALLYQLTDLLPESYIPYAGVHRSYSEGIIIAAA